MVQSTLSSSSLADVPNACRTGVPFQRFLKSSCVMCNHSVESYRAVVFHGRAVFDIIAHAALLVLTFKSLDETLVCDHSSESY